MSAHRYITPTRLKLTGLIRVGWSRGLGYSPGPPNARFREFRRLFQQFMGQRALSPQSPIVEMQRQENIRFLDKMMRDPQKFFDHARE